MLPNDATDRLAAAGFPDPADEAAVLVRCPDPAAALARRLTGEPLEWITGEAVLDGETVAISPGLYVPRWETGMLARRAIEVLDRRTRGSEPGRVAVDLCTGCGAVAAVIARRRPAVTVLASDIDPLAVATARANGVACVAHDLADGNLPAALAAVAGTVDVVTAVAPYVPTESLHLLPRDVRAFEPRRALDGGPGGLTLLTAAVHVAGRLLRPGGVLLVEVGAGHDRTLAPVLAATGFGPAAAHCDGDGDLRLLEAVLVTRVGDGGPTGAATPDAGS